MNEGDLEANAKCHGSSITTKLKFQAVYQSSRSWTSGQHGLHGAFRQDAR